MWQRLERKISFLWLFVYFIFFLPSTFLVFLLLLFLLSAFFFNIRIFPSAFCQPHPPSAGIRSAFYRHPFKRLVYTPPDSSPRFTCKLNLSNTKNPAWFFILASLLDRGMQRVNWLPPRTIVARVFLKIIFRGCPIIHSLSNGAMLERVVNATLWCNS